MDREKNYDLLRGLSCIFIVLLHVASLYTEDEKIFSAYSGMAFSFCDFLQIITRTAVPCFVMLSGAFILGRKKLDISSFYKKSLIKLGIPTVVFSLIFIAVRLLTKASVKTVFIDTINGKPNGHMWYMFMLVGLYLISPFVYYLKEAVSDRAFIIYTVIAVVLSGVVHFTCQLIWPVMFLEYIGYFMAGYCIRKKAARLRIAWPVLLILSVVFLLLTYLLNELSFYRGCYSAPFYRHPDFPSVIAASLLWFAAFSKMKVRHISRPMGIIVETSMIIYLVHPLIYGFINKLLTAKVFKTLPSPYWYVPALFAVCFILSVIFSVIYMKVSSLISSKLSGMKANKKI